MQAEHFRTTKALKSNEELVISRPLKAKGVVIMEKSDHEQKMLEIINDTTKFKRLGHFLNHDLTSSFERSLQTFLFELSKPGEIGESVY